jgi:PiT family inorganic phosphate transporter
VTGMIASVVVTTVLYRLVDDGGSVAERWVMRALSAVLIGGFFAFILNLMVGEALLHFAEVAVPWWVWLAPGLGLSVPVLRGVIGKGPYQVNGWFRGLQTLSAGFMALEHGHNDAQKTMGIITLALIAEGQITKEDGVPLWVKLACAVVIGAGTFSGGKRIIKTMGMKLVKLEPIDGFAAETVAATVIQVAGQYGMPISTTHAITASITGVGATKRISAVKWGVTVNILFAWIVTLPAAALIAALAYVALHAIL